MAASTPLESEIRQQIAQRGPIPVSEYMELCLTHPLHGYYLRRDPLGKMGDFITAPEVSQMFGELIGLWTAAVWRLMGAPDAVRLVELGPGRGTMMNDALRAMQVMPSLREALDVHLVEISPALERTQRQTLEKSGVPITWQAKLDDVPADRPTIILANEFLDALPVHQAMRLEDGWHYRVVALDGNGNFRFAQAPEPIARFETILPPKVGNAPEGSIYEWRSDNIAFEIGRRVRKNGAALLIDYGHAESDIGDTVQSVGEHAFADPLSAPGMLDITAHVDFQAVGQAAENMGARMHGPVAQATFLRRLGIESRAGALKANAPAKKAEEIDAALTRLTQGGRTGMGELFKAMALADPKLGPLPAFET